ncbi:MAG: hypothetical protein ACHQC8_02010 [Solirubrobacterales bacterium]
MTAVTRQPLTAAELRAEQALDLAESATQLARTALALAARPIDELREAA